jgi:hypothetical protein
MLISAERLVAILADRLDPVAPRPFRVTAKGTDLVVEHPHGWGVVMDVAWIQDEGEDRTAAQMAGVIVGNALNELQDAVSESSKEPWPALSPTVMAPYHVRTDATSVFFWYGTSETAPVIGFTPIALSEVARP